MDLGIFVTSGALKWMNTHRRRMKAPIQWTTGPSADKYADNLRNKGMSTQHQISILHEKSRPAQHISASKEL